MARAENRRTRAAIVGLCLAAGAGGLSTGCGTPVSEPGTTSHGACRSRYFETARAETRSDLLPKLRPEVTYPVVRELGETFERGGAQVRLVFFVDRRNERRQVGGPFDVVRLTDGTWFAGQWGQCIDSGDGSVRYPSGWPSE